MEHSDEQEFAQEQSQAEHSQEAASHLVARARSQAEKQVKTTQIHILNPRKVEEVATLQETLHPQ